MNSSARRVAVLGGVRIPFARRNGPYAQASNQDMLTATLDAVADKFELRGAVLGDVAAGAQPRLQFDPRERARIQARSRDARL
jgi:acetyl-CoA C-acetyltransferase